MRYLEQDERDERVTRWTSGASALAVLSLVTSGACAARDPDPTPDLTSARAGAAGSVDGVAEVAPPPSSDLVGFPPVTCDWPQAFGTASHAGLPCPELRGMRLVARLPQDDDADAENAASGFLQVHESPPLTSGDYVLIGHKSGFTSVLDRSTERYDARAYRWVPSVTSPLARLVPAWQASTDWQPVDGKVKSLGYVTNGYVALFGPAIGRGSVYVPAAAGRLQRRDLATGQLLATIDPFAGTALSSLSGDDRVVVNDALSIDLDRGDGTTGDGTVYYTIVAWPLGTPVLGAQPRGSWLVAVSPDDRVRIADWSTIASPTVGVPRATDLCDYPFGTGGTPPPNGPDARAPQFKCGAQRPAMNAPVAVDPATGHLVVYSYANNAQGVAFLVEVDPKTLTPIRAYDTRGHLHHGCGVRLDLGDPACQVITAGGTTNLGNDPDYNAAVRFRGGDLMDSAPSIAPDGTRSICGYDGGFSFGGGYDARGACVRFDQLGNVASTNEEFGWEVTESAWRHGDAFSRLQDRQLYSALTLTVGQYAPGGSLEAAQALGQLDTSLPAIDFLDAHVTFGTAGDRYAVNGDGHLYKFSPGRATPSSAVALLGDDGKPRSMEGLAAYAARDRAGRVLVSHAGSVWVVGSLGVATGGDAGDALATDVPATAAVRRGAEAKRRAAASAPLPPPAE